MLTTAGDACLNSAMVDFSSGQNSPRGETARGRHSDHLTWRYHPRVADPTQTSVTQSKSQSHGHPIGEPTKLVVHRVVLLIWSFDQLLNLGTAEVIVKQLTRRRPILRF